MAHLDAFALKATGTEKTLAAPAIAVWLSSPVAGTGRHVGLTGENPETRTTWIHVADVGEWDGHTNGPFKLTRESFAQCVAALRACETPAMVDYDHASLRPLDGGPTIAAGYILDLEVRDDGLYALCELTKRAAAMVQAGEYRFCSGVFVWDAPDRATGEPIPCQLDSIGLTNKPFIDGQHAIRLSRRALGASMEIKKSELMSKLDALVSGATVTSDEIKALVDFLEKSSGKPEGEGGSGEVELPAELSAPAAALSAAPLAAPPPAAMADPMLAEVPVEVPAESVDGAAMVLTKLTELTGLDNVALLASIDANADAVKQAILGSAPAAALSADIKDQTIAALSREVTVYRAEAAKRAEAELAGEVDALVKSGKALPSQRTQMLALAKASPAQFRALASTMPVIVPMGRDTPPEVPPTASSELVASNDSIPSSDPIYIALAKRYEESAWSRLLPKNPAERAKTIDRLVRSELKRAQPISG